MSDEGPNQNHISLITGFSLFLFGALINAISTMKIKELNSEIQDFMIFVCLLAVLTLFLSIVFGAVLFLQMNSLNSANLDSNKVLDDIISLLIISVISIVAILVLMLTGSIIALIAFCIFAGLIMVYSRRKCSLR